MQFCIYGVQKHGGLWVFTTERISADWHTGNVKNVTVHQMPQSEQMH